MATYKRITGDYNITTLNSFDNVNITTHTVNINGNLDVIGNVNAIDFIDITNLVVDDPVIVLANGQSGAPVYDIGIIGDRGTSSNIAIFWDEGNAEFRMGFTNDSGNVTDITLTGFAPLQVANLTATNVSLTGNLAVATLAVTGNITGNNLSVFNDINVSGNVFASQDVDVAGQIRSTGNITTASTLTADVLLANSISTGNGAAGFGNLSAGNLILTGNIEMPGVILANGVITNGTVGISTTGANITVAEDGGVGGWVVANNITASGNITIDGQANIADNLGVAGQTFLEDVDIAGGVFVGGNIGAGGNLSISRDLTVSGDITATDSDLLIGNVTVMANIDAGNISVTGLTTTSGNITTTANVTAVGLTASGNITASAIQATLITGNLTAAGTNTQIQFNDSGNIGASSGLTFDRASNLLFVGGNVNSDGNLIVTSEAFIGANTYISGNLQVVGNINALSFVDLDTGNLQITLANLAANPTAANSAGLVVNGADASMLYYSIPDAWVFNKNMEVQGTGTWTGNITAPWFLGNLDATQAAVSANISGGNLGIAGVTDLTGAVTMGATLAVSGTTTLGQFVTMGDASGGTFTVRNTGTGTAYVIGAGSGIATSGTNQNLILNPNGTGTIELEAATNVTGDLTATGDLAVGGNLALTGTVTTGTWQAAEISTAYTQAKVTSVNALTGAIVDVALTTGTLAQFAATTSAQLAGVISDETGSGSLVFGTSPTFTTQITTPAIAKSGTSGVGDIGSALNSFNLVYARATSAQYADLAEMYTADADWEPGTVVIFGGPQEITRSEQDQDTRVAGIISTQPAHLMNSAQSGLHVLPVALAGRVPCRVRGPIQRGDLLVSTSDGRARAADQPPVGSVIGKALADFSGTEGVIEVVVGVR